MSGGPGLLAMLRMIASDEGDVEMLAIRSIKVSKELIQAIKEYRLSASTTNRYAVARLDAALSRALGDDA